MGAHCLHMPFFRCFGVKIFRTFTIHGMSSGLLSVRSDEFFMFHLINHVKLKQSIYTFQNWSDDLLSI